MMNKRPNLKNLVFLLLAAALPVNCRKTSRDVVIPVDPGLPLTVAQGPEIESYPFEDQGCQALERSAEDPALSPITEVSLNSWEDGSVVRKSLNTADLKITGFPLKSPLVTKVTSEDVFQRACNANMALPPDCLSREMDQPGWSAAQTGKAIKICKQIVMPERMTLEHMALSVVVTIEKTGRAFKDLIPAGLSLEEITVMAAPRFESRWTPWTNGDQRGSYLTLLAENLAYFPPTSTTPPFIAILPKNTAEKNTTRLWESEFVIAHEYSHHLERVLKLDRFDEKRSHVRIAASEAFADIMAYASQGAMITSIKGIPCVGIDRAPDQLEFNNGIAKIIDDELLDRLLRKSARDDSTSSATVDEAQPICHGVIPHSPHGIGAIFAHWLAEFAALTPGFDDARAKTTAELSIDWLRNIESSIGAGTSSTKKDLEYAARSLEKSVIGRYEISGIELTDNLRIMLCQKMRLAFPAIKDLEWFGRTGC